jgi:type III secretion system low calcium response chaperone LcrH/SycD
MKHAKQAIKKAVQQTGERIGQKRGEAFSQMTNKALQKGASIKDVLGIADASIESVYGQAYLLYNTGRYRDAAEIFRLLIMLNSTEPKYLMGLAACYHMLKEYLSAASTYNLVSIIDPNNPIPYFHASDCYIHTGDKTAAAVMLEMAVKRAGDKPEFATLLQRAAITLDALKKEITQGKAPA